MASVLEQKAALADARGEVIETQNQVIASQKQLIEMMQNTSEVSEKAISSIDTLLNISSVAIGAAGLLTSLMAIALGLIALWGWSKIKSASIEAAKLAAENMVNQNINDLARAVASQASVKYIAEQEDKMLEALEGLVAQAVKEEAGEREIMKKLELDSVEDKQGDLELSTASKDK